jgi:mRNA-degrading endonuclease RelE of RelBE toxin-antitoxin system
LKRIVISEEAKADIRAIPQHIAMNILTAIHRLAESGAGRVKTLQDQDREKRLRVCDYRVRFTEEHPDTLRIHAVKNRKDAYR